MSQRVVSSYQAAVVMSLLAVGAGEAVAAPALSFSSAVRLQLPVGATGTYQALPNYGPVSAGPTFAAVGNGSYDSTFTAVRWSPSGVGTRLGDFAGTPSSRTDARGMSDNGYVVGYAFRPVNGVMGNYAVRWDAAGNVTLLGQPAGASESYANGVNAAGTAAGYTYTSGLGNRAAAWSATGVATRLGDVAGQTTTNSYAYNLNDAGQVAGYAVMSGLGARAVRWEQDGTATRLGDVAGYTVTGSHANDVNASGQVAGDVQIPGLSNRAARWNADGTAVLLGDLPNTPVAESLAYGITDGGLAVGYSYTGGAFNTATVWDVDGKAYRLADLVLDDADWTFTSAKGISVVDGVARVVTYGSAPGRPEGYYVLTGTLTAVPEPAALALIALSAPALLRRRR